MITEPAKAAMIKVARSYLLDTEMVLLRTTAGPLDIEGRTTVGHQPDAEGTPFKGHIEIKQDPQAPRNEQYFEVLHYEIRTPLDINIKKGDRVLTVDGSKFEILSVQLYENKLGPLYQYCRTVETPAGVG